MGIIPKPYYNPKKKREKNGVFDSSNEAPGRTDYNAKTSTLYNVSLLKKLGKLPKNDHFSKKDHFG